MSLIENLQNLDLTPILNARAGISGTIGGEEVQRVVSGGAAATSLGDVGRVIEAVRNVGDDPEALLQPLISALTDAVDLTALDDLDISAYVKAVREGVTLITDLKALLEGDLSRLGRISGIALGDIFDAISRTANEYAHVSLESLEPLKELIARIDSGPPADPEALVALALDVLLPFPQDSLRDLRRGLDGLLARVSAISLPDDLTAELNAALETVIAASASGDDAALRAALQSVEQARTHVLETLRSALADARSGFEGLQLEQLLEPLGQAAATLRAGEQDAVAFLEMIRQYIEVFRVRIENTTAEELSDFLNGLMPVLDGIEVAAHENLIAPIDQKVEELKAWVRSLLSHLQLRTFRSAIRTFFQDAAQSIRDADLDRFAKELEALLNDAAETIASADLNGLLSDALEDVATVITEAANALSAALTEIAGAVDGLTEQAEAVLQPVVDAVGEFRAAIDQAVGAAQQLDLDAATQQVIDAIGDLQATAEKLLTEVELPEGLKPIIDQLTAELEGIDLEGLIVAPVRDALEQLKLPPELESEIRSILERVQEVLQNLIPTQLIASIQAEIEEAIGVLTSFDPSMLTAELDRFVLEAADAIAALDPIPVLNEIRQPFQAVLDGVDAIHPERLLEPVLSAYDELIGSLDAPVSTEETVTKILSGLDEKGEELGQAMTGPIQNLASSFGGDDAVTVRDPDAPPVLPELPGGVRPGDLIRLFGYLPGKLREALQSVEAGPAGDVFGQVEALTSGLARDIGALEAALWHIEDRIAGAFDGALASLAVPQLRAQFALSARADLGQAELSAGLDVLATVSPDALRAELEATLGEIRDDVRAGIRAFTELAAGPLSGASRILSSSRVAQFGDLDALLDALDPEPIAEALDALVLTLYNRLNELLPAVQEVFRDLMLRVQRLIRELNPMSHAQKFLGVIDVVREELEVLNPHTLVADVAEVHAALRESIVAYDPASFADEISGIIQAVANQLRTLTPSAVLETLNLDSLKAAVEQVKEIDPAALLSTVGQPLIEVGEALAQLDPAALLNVIDTLGPEIAEQFERAVEAIHEALVRLLRSIQYASAGAGASISADINV